VFYRVSQKVIAQNRWSLKGGWHICLVHQAIIDLNGHAKQRSRQ